MELIPLSPLTAAPAAIRPTAPITFNIVLRGFTGRPSVLTLYMEDNHGLVFTNGKKWSQHLQHVGNSATPVLLPETIFGG